MNPANLLVISRSRSLARRLQEAVGAGEVRAHWLPSTASALATDLDPALIVTELPESGGERTLARLKRRWHVPLLVLQRADQPPPAGADASHPRSTPMPDLAHTIRDTLHRHTPGVLHAGALALDTQSRRLQVRDQFHTLRPIACQILARLMEAPGQTLARDELFRRVWQTDDADHTRALDVHVSHLRQVIEEDPRHPRLLVTERGLGYRLEPDHAP